MMLDLKNTTDAIITLDQAFVVPPLTEARLRDQPSGVLDAQGNFVENSVSWTNSKAPVNSAPQIPPGTPVKTLKGHYIFGGIFYGHFGHFIVETLARTWAIGSVTEPVDGIIFTPKVPNITDRHSTIYQDMFSAFGVSIPIVIAKEVTQVERLSVPRQGFGMYDLIEGSEAFRDYVNERVAVNVPPKGAEKIYVSRSGLPAGRGSLLGEYKIEEYLAAEGYEIFHPQRHSQNDQMAAYKAARQIVSTDCSPLHLLGYVGDAGQNTAILTRRSMDIGSYLVTQLRSFKSMKVSEVNALTNDWLPQPGSRPSRSSWGEVDFPTIHAALLQAGLIQNPTPWPNLTAEEHAQELARLTQSHKAAFVPFRKPAA